MEPENVNNDGQFKVNESTFPRRNFIKRSAFQLGSAFILSQGLSLANGTASGTASATGSPTPSATGTPYHLQSVFWKGGTWSDPTYNEMDLGSVLSRYGVTYYGKFKIWVTPATGQSNSQISEEFCLEIYPAGTGAIPGTAPLADSSKRKYVVKLPDQYSPNVSVDSYATGILEVYTAEFGGDKFYYQSPTLPNQEGLPSWWGSSGFPLPPLNGAVSYSSKIHLYVTPMVSSATPPAVSNTFEVVLETHLKTVEVINVYDDNWLLTSTTTAPTFAADSKSTYIEVDSNPGLI